MGLAKSVEVNMLSMSDLLEALGIGAEAVIECRADVKKQIEEATFRGLYNSRFSAPTQGTKRPREEEEQLDL